MSYALGMAWGFHSSKYRKQFNQPTPAWVNQLDTLKRLRLIKVAMALNWKLPDEILE